MAKNNVLSKERTSIQGDIIDVMIYLPDNTGHQVHIQDGKTTTTTKFFETMVAALDLPAEPAQKCFALWLKSPLLDVQLRPHHVPFRMVRQWGLLIDKFSAADDVVKMKDEPALVFKRNAFLTKEEEAKIHDKKILDILLMEAKSNIQNGIYPCDREDVEQLGILLCVMNKHQCRGKDVKTEQKSFRNTIQGVIPEHMVRHRKTIFRRQKSFEDHVYHSFRHISNKEEVENAQLEFMKICWQLPYYGSVMFEGEVENKNNKTLASWFLSSSTMQVRVAINTTGIWIINSEKKHVLLGLTYGEFNWEVATKQPDEDDENAGDDRESIPSLFIEFDEDKTTKLLQIISKQASMMNSMIETCTAAALQAQHLRKSPLKSPDEVKSEDSPHKEMSFLSSSRVRPLFDRQSSVTHGRPGKLSCLTVQEQADHHQDSKTKSSVTDESELQNHLSRIQHARNFFRRSTKSNKTLTSEEERDELL
ncbi:putative FERM domain-containing protein FRMD8P1 isoform X1 [Styela clava]